MPSSRCSPRMKRAAAGWSLVPDAEELTQQQVLGVHRHVGLEVALPPALGRPAGASRWSVARCMARCGGVLHVRPPRGGDRRFRWPRQRGAPGPRCFRRSSLSWLPLRAVWTSAVLGSAVGRCSRRSGSTGRRLREGYSTDSDHLFRTTTKSASATNCARTSFGHVDTRPGPRWRSACCRRASCGGPLPAARLFDQRRAGRELFLGEVLEVAALGVGGEQFAQPLARRGRPRRARRPPAGTSCAGAGRSRSACRWPPGRPRCRAGRRRPGRPGRGGSRTPPACRPCGRRRRRAPRRWRRRRRAGRPVLLPSISRHSSTVTRSRCSKEMSWA